MSSVGDRTGREYWRSLSELADSPEFREFVHREFPAGAAEMLDSSERRHFLKIMGASMALAGLGISGCRRWPDEKIAPYAKRPQGQDPGVSQHFATTMEIDGVASGLLVTAFDGRPTKVEGNPEHPLNAGGTNLHDQASVLDLYDPDRSREVLRDGAPSTWSDFATWAREHFGPLRNSGRGMRFLSEATSSPSVAAMRRRIREVFPDARWHEWAAINDDAVIAGTTLAFGAPYRPHYRLGEAQIVVSLDDDFLGAPPFDVATTRGFAAGRKRGADDPETMNRLYAFEGAVTLTGMNADLRVAVRSSDIGRVAAWLAGRVLGDAALGAAGEGLAPDVVAGLESALADIEAHHGHGLIVAGRGQPPAVHALVALMNDALDNAGRTVSYMAAPDAIGKVQSIVELCRDIDEGRVETLIMLGGNPVYDGPADLDVAARLGAVATTIHLADYPNETSEGVTWHLNRAHYLEAWGDARAGDGTIGITQPLIEPFFDGRSAVEVLATIVGDPQESGYDIVRRTYADLTGASFDAASGSLSNAGEWRRVLRDGFIRGSAYSLEAPRPRADTVALAAGLGAPATGTEIVFLPDAKVYDGRYANNGWLQELPDPLTKLTWDNCVRMSPRSAEALGVEQGDVVRIGLGGATVEGAVFLVPGQHPDTVAVTVGYGRTFAGRVSTGAGFDAYPLRTAQAMSFAAGATVEATGETYPLATTQDHHAIDVEKIGGQGQQRRLPTLYREASAEHYHEHPDFVKHATHVTHRLSLWEEDLPHQNRAREPGNHAWGMTIDLTTCTGCSACVVACQAENNIPIVGKDQVLRGREMHWMRIDRYYRFRTVVPGKRWDADHVESFALMPVNCLMCENAPCEQVCPVAATVHDTEGLNVMVYNRCVGTRYCSNNCPYKVRRFNYYDFHRREPLREQPGLLQVQPDYYKKAPSTSNPLRHLQFNPEVTVRMRGVMEKCTYCVQRIMAGKIAAKDAWVATPPDQRPDRMTVRDGSVTPACAQACPAEAITFGDLDDPASRVFALQQGNRAYDLLEELNTKPRTRYLAKLRNPAGAGAASHAGEGAHG